MFHKILFDVYLLECILEIEDFTENETVCLDI